MLKLSDKWAPVLTAQPETGMGYWIATVILKDGRKFSNTVVDSGWISKVGDSTKIPFVETDIESIVVDHGDRRR
jgi:hypothetical protein